MGTNTAKLWAENHVKVKNENDVKVQNENDVKVWKKTASAWELKKLLISCMKTDLTFELERMSTT